MFEYSETESILVKTFAELTKDHSLTTDDNLHSKGLDSLQCVAGAMLLRKHGIRLKPQDIMRHQTVRALADHLCKIEINPGTTTEKKPHKPHSFPMTPTQRDWQQSGFIEHYNIYGGWTYCQNTFCRELFAKAVQQLVENQDELRLRISKCEDELEFNCEPPSDEPYLEVIDLSYLSIGEAKTKAVNMCHKLQRDFRFDGKSSLCRFIDFQFDQEGNGWIFIIVHHYTIDGFGWGNLLRKISHLYSSIQDGLEANDIYGGSGASRYWSEALKKYGTGNFEELSYWKSLPWNSFNRELRDSLHSETVSIPVGVFNDKDAAKLHGIGACANTSDPAVIDIFESQATVITYLDPSPSKLLLEQAWSSNSDAKFDDFDLFSAAVSHALTPYCTSSHLWIDMLAAARSGVFEDIDASGSLGYFSELTPFASPVLQNQSVLETACAIASFREDQPKYGVGFRALKTYAKDPKVQSMLSKMRRPQVGINYHASLLYAFSGTMLDLPKVTEWLGPTMDENGIRYRFWYRVSFVDNCLEIVLRYDPTRYTVEDGIAGANGTTKILHEFLLEYQ